MGIYLVLSPGETQIFIFDFMGGYDIKTICDFS